MRAIAARTPAMEELAEAFAENLKAELSVDIHPLNVVFDIPPRRSAANDVFIVSVDSPRREVSGQLSEKWPIWGQFAGIFDEVTRRIRIFCPKDDYDRIVGAAGENEPILYDALRRAALDVSRAVFQFELFSDALVEL